MHRKLGFATLSLLAFSGEGNSNLPLEKSRWQNTAVKRYMKKKSNVDTPLSELLNLQRACVRSNKKIVKNENNKMARSTLKIVQLVVEWTKKNGWKTLSLVLNLHFHPSLQCRSESRSLSSWTCVRSVYCVWFQLCGSVGRILLRGKGRGVTSLHKELSAKEARTIAVFTSDLCINFGPVLFRHS